MGMWKGCRPRRLRRRLQDSEFPARAAAAAWARALARAVKWRARVIAGDADFVLGLLVERLQVVVGDGPVFERTACGRAVGGPHAEILRHVAPGLRAVAERPAADAGSIVLVGALAGQDSVQAALGIHPDAGIAFIFGAKGVAEHGGALVAQDRLCGSRAAVYHLPRSSSTTLKPATASSLATMPPAAPAPITTAFTRFMSGEPFLRSYCARPRDGRLGEAEHPPAQGRRDCRRGAGEP